MKTAQGNPVVPDWHRVISFGWADWEGERNKIAVKQNPSWTIRVFRKCGERL